VVLTSDSSDDLVGIGGPDEGLGIVIGLGEVAADGGLEVDQRSEHTAFQPSFRHLAKKPSTALNHEADIGV
jgi:hypothetical protein